MRRFLLRVTGILLAIIIVATSLSLLIGRFTPAEMVTTTMRQLVRVGNRIGPVPSILMLDLNRHLRVHISIPFDVAILDVEIDQNGQEAEIQTFDSESHFYRYNLTTNTISELNLNYTDPETGEVFMTGNIYDWTNHDGDLWRYNLTNGTVYHFDAAHNLIQSVVTLVDENGAFPTPNTSSFALSFSSSGSQIALIDHHALYLFNPDGSHLQRYTNPIDADNSYGYWSQDERYFYISQFQNSPDALMAFRILDLNSGEIVPATQDLEGSSFFSSCWQNNEWLAYADTEHQAQLINIQTGETQNLSLAPELSGQSVYSVSWLSDCQWLLVYMTAPSNNTSLGFQYRQIYIVSRDGQTVYSLDTDVAILSQIDDSTFLLAEAHGTADNVYEVHFDGTVQRTFVGNFILNGNWLNALRSDPFRLLMYNSQNNQVAVFNVHSGIIETYFTPDELIGSFPIQWIWN